MYKLISYYTLIMIIMYTFLSGLKVVTYLSLSVVIEPQIFSGYILGTLLNHHRQLIV